MELRGMRYHPIDIETSVIRAHKSIMEWCVSVLPLIFNLMLIKHVKSLHKNN